MVVAKVIPAELTQPAIVRWISSNAGLVAHLSISQVDVGVYFVSPSEVIALPEIRRRRRQKALG